MTARLNWQGGAMGRKKKTDAERRRKYSFSMAAETMTAVEREAKADKRTLSSMVEVLLLEAVESRKIGKKK